MSGVGSADVGHEVPVRVGPLGPYAGGLDRSRHLLVPGAIGWVATLPVVVVFSFFLFRGRARARRVLAQLGDGVGPSLTGRHRWRDDRRSFATAHVRSGGVAFFIARRSGGFAVFDPGGRLMLGVRRVGDSPSRLRLLTPDRTPLGEIATYPGTEDQPGVAFLVTTENGERVAVVVAGFLRWTVVFDGEPPEHLRHAVTAFAFDSLRLTR